MSVPIAPDVRRSELVRPTLAWHQRSELITMRRLAHRAEEVLHAS
jgi:hypothetical protein